ncbi:MAG: relaxase/mobilization nuclease domain-containing protein [Chitinophagaceae bacterium]
MSAVLEFEKYRNIIDELVRKAKKMISKVITGKTFYGTCRYICMDQKRALVLETEGVRGHNYKLMAADFDMQRELRPTLGTAVFHGILSFYPGEKIEDKIMTEIAKEYLQKLGITNTQYSITKHNDKNHSHLHIIANLVNNNGGVIKDSWIGLKGKKLPRNSPKNMDYMKPFQKI